MSDLKTNLEQILQEKQDKIKPENIKKDIQIFDITGTYEGNSGDVKLFETEEQMQQDPNANEGDLAVVYREEIKNMTSDTQTQYITFPETVTLPSAITESYYCMLRSIDPSKMFDGNIMLDKTSFRFDGWSEIGMIRVSYTSSDGITYTKQEFMGDNGELTNPVDLGTEIRCEMQEEWNDNFGYFMQIEGNTFEGLFECNNIPNPDTVSAYKFYKYIEENGERIPDKEDTEFTKEEVTLFKECMENSNFNSSAAVLIKNLDTEEYYVVSTKGAAVLLTSEKAYICGIPPRDNEESVDFNNALYKINTNTKILEQLHIASSITAIQGDDCWFGCPLPNMNKIQISRVGYPDFEESDVRYYANNNQYVNIDLPPRTNVLKYELAPTQFNLTASNELLPGKIAYSKNGVVTGDNTLYDNLDNEKVWNKIFNISTSISDYGSMQDEVSPKYQLGNYSYMELSPNKLYAFNQDKDSDKYLLRNIDNGNIFNNPIGVGNNVLYYYSLANSNLTIYELNKTSNNIKSYNIDLGMTTKKFSVSASNGLVYMLYSTDGKDIYVKRYSLETQELDELYYNADDLYTYFGTIVAAQGNAIYTYRNKQDRAYNINLINGTTKQITTISGGYVSAYICGYSEDQKIIYGNYNNPTKSWWVYDFTTSQFYTFDTDVAPSYGQLHNFCDANKVFLGFTSSAKNISIYNTDTHSLYLQPITNFNGSSASNFILKKDRYIYTSNLNSNCKINLDTFTAEPLSVSFSSSNRDKYPIDIEETLISISIVRPSTEGLSYETCYKVTASSIDLTKTNDFIILFTYRTNTTDQVIVVFVDNTLSDGVLTEEEYNKALATAKQIKGSE